MGENRNFILSIVAILCFVIIAGVLFVQNNSLSKQVSLGLQTLSFNQQNDIIAVNNKINTLEEKINTKQIVTSTLTENYPTNEEECKIAGGDWRQMNMSGYMGCDLPVPPTSDGGKACKDGIECEGSCLADSQMGKINSGDKIIGECSTIKNVGLGCHVFVREGKADILCAD